MTYNPYNLIEILCSLPDVTDTGWAKDEDGISGRILKGPSKRICVIDTSEDSIDDDEVAGILMFMGLGHLVEAMCPEVSKQILQEKYKAAS